MLRMPSSQPPTEDSTIVSAGRNAVVDRAADELPAPLRAVGELEDVVAAEDREPPRCTENTATSTSASQKYGIDCSTVVTGHQVVDPGAAPPPDPGADADAEHERDDGRDPDQDDRPRQRRGDELGDRRRVLRDRDAEVALEHPAPVGDVLLPHRRGRRRPEEEP